MGNIINHMTISRGNIVMNEFSCETLADIIDENNFGVALEFNVRVSNIPRVGISKSN